MSKAQRCSEHELLREPVQTDEQTPVALNLNTIESYTKMDSEG